MADRKVDAAAGYSGEGDVESASLMQKETAQSVQLRVVKGELDGQEGLLIPYAELSRALHIPAGYFMVELADLGDEVQVVLCDRGTVSRKGGLTRFVSSSRCVKFIPKDAFLELIFWKYDGFRAEFLMCKPGCPLQIIVGDPILIRRNMDFLFMWIEEDDQGCMEFTAEGGKK